jgi:hypothetical protein
LRLIAAGQAGPGLDFLAVRPLEGLLGSSAMQPLRAHVHNGRIVLDEPTDLPDGEVIELVPIQDVLAAGDDYLDDEEQARLHDSMEWRLEDVRAGRTVEASKVIERIRAQASRP